MKSNEITRLVVTRDAANNHPCLDSYLDADLKRTKTLLSGGRAEEDHEVFSASVLNLTSVIDDFMRTSNKELSVLVLGKIQSGKTAHMLGTLAWAVDTKIALTIIFTGVTGDLNDQTVSRLNTSLGSLNPAFIEVFLVPTSHESTEYEVLRERLEDLIFQRITREHSATGVAMPVLTALKTIPRIETLEYLHRELSDKFGSDIISLFFDDEADQASQNSGASKGEVTAIYRGISKVRKSLVRNVYLAYTATPQAVLLTERYGNLRPDYCVVVPPRSNYFGLNDMTSDAYAGNLVEVSDWQGPSAGLTTIPESLKNCLHQYFWSAAIRFHSPEVFYTESDLPKPALKEFISSTQMMIHESSKVRFHSAMHRLVDEEVSSLMDDLKAFQFSQMTNEMRDGFIRELNDSWEKFRERIPGRIAEQLPWALTDALINTYTEVVADNQIVVVNADPKKPNKEVDFPIEVPQWQTHKSWICIGGDILGRGLTIPQLLSTYFLRTSKSPNFDTVSQQMRFCGYRKGYQAFTTIWAQSATFMSFQYMQEIESVVWNRAKRWDEERIEINIHIPRVLYASPITANMEPTRKSVRDPNLVDSKVKGEIVFSAAKIMAPQLFRANLGIMRRWIGDVENHLKAVQDWYLVEDLRNEDVYSLLGQWTSDPQEEPKLLGAMELFAADMTALGLAGIPRALFISKDVLEYPPFRDVRDIEDLVKKTRFFRTIVGIGATLRFSDWVDGVVNNRKLADFERASVTHIGGTLRKLRDQLQFDSTVLIIEFMRGVQKAEPLDQTVALGLTLTILSPSNYEVRTIGHA